MQVQQPAYGTAAQGQGAGEASLAMGSDAWARSVLLVIAAIGIIGVLFVGALLLMYFGSVRPKGTRETVALKVVEPPVDNSNSKPTAAVSQSKTEAPAPAVAVLTRRQTPPITEATVTAPPQVTAAISAPSRTTERELQATPKFETPVPATAQPEPVTSAPTETPVVAAVIQPPSAPPAAPPAEVPLKTEPVAAPLAPPVMAAIPPSTESKPVQIAAIEPPSAARPGPAENLRADPPETLAPVVLRPVSRPQPQFPRQALSEGVTRGSVVARVTVATDGRVSAVTIVSSTPPRLFDRAAQDTLAAWRFEPIPRQTTAQIELAFRAE